MDRCPASCPGRSSSAQSPPRSGRSKKPTELLPTLTQLRRKRPDASLRWFQRGRLWLSPDDAKAALARERSDARGRPATWRPGGKHVDPRQKSIDAKKAKWTEFKSAIRERAESQHDPQAIPTIGLAPSRPRTRRRPSRKPAGRTPRDEAGRRRAQAEHTRGRDQRVGAEPGDAPRLIRKPAARRPQPIEPDAPVARDRKPASDA